MSLLVAEHHDIDAGIAARFLNAAGGLERVDAAERAIEPAGMVLRFQMRAGKDFAAARPALSQNIADAIDRRLEAGLGAPLREPLPRCDVFGRKRRAVHASLVGAEGAQLIEIAEQAVGLDGGHGTLSSFRNRPKAGVRNP